MKALLQLIIITLLPFGLSAQQGMSGPGKGSVKGKIVDGDSKQAIEFATISLHSAKDSSLITGTTAKGDGSFELDKVDYGNYYLRMGFVGYKTSYYSKVVLNNDNKTFDAGIISLSSSMENLEEVQVTAEKRQMETMIDKKIFNVDKTPAAAGGDGLEVLRNVPSVDVDIDGNISLRGESNVNILVDGRPINMSAAQFLQSTPASSIEKIELITNPSAKYDPEGTSGIINIILKKDKKGGFNGNINTSMGYGIYPKNNNALALNYRKGKVNLQSSLSANYSKSWYGGVNERNIYLPDTNFYQTTRDSGFNENLNLSAKLGIDYYLNDKTTLYASGTLMGIRGNGSRDMNYLNYDANRQLVSQSGREARVTYPVDGLGLNGGFQHKFNDKGHNLDLDINYGSNDQTSSERFLQQFLDPDGEKFAEASEQIQENSEYRSVFNSRLDYVLPINDSSNFEAGYHTTLRRFDNDIFLANEDSNGTFQAIDSLNNRFKYAENVQALYTTISRDFRKWALKGGLRYEYTYTNGELVNTNETAGVNYHSFFPSAYVSYKLSPTNNVQVSYTRRINRPSEGQLNPFTSYSDPYTIRTGNPFLKPEFIDVYELGYNRYGKKLNINASVYTRTLHNQIGRFLLLNDNGTNTVIFRNFDNSYMYGAELILTYNPFTWWRTTTSFNYWSTTFDAASFTQQVINYTNDGYSIFLNNMHNIDKNWMLQWNVQYRGKMNVLQGKITPMFGIDFSARRNLWDGKGSISLRVSDIFNTREFGFDSMPLEFYEYETLRNWESQTVYLSFNYNFGKMDRSNSRRRRSYNDGNDNRPDTGF